MKFARFMSSASGRGLRVAAGLVLIGGGIALGSTGGWVIAVIGVVPLAAGALNVCLLGPLLGAPLHGASGVPPK